MFEWYSVVLLLCGVSTDSCETIALEKFHRTQHACILALDEYEKTNGKELAKKERYIMSGVCIDWRFQVQKMSI